jgi:predicted amidophosphoribosyltransferase
MIFLSKYQDNQTTEPVKIKTSPFRNLDRTYNLIEEVFRRKNHQEEKLIFGNLWSKNGE